MRPPRNPFRLRASEQLDDDWTFLSLYEPGLLTFLPEEDLWDRRVIVRSSPGGGKTTVLRLFTPGPLRLLHSHRRDDSLKDLNTALTRRGAIDGRGPLVAGALLSLAGKYAPLEHLADVSAGRRLRTFLALLNARVLLSAMRAQLELKGMEYPADLSRLTLKPAADNAAPSGLELPASGESVYRWAKSVETQVAQALSSLGPSDEERLPGEDELACLELLAAGAIEIDGDPVRARTLVMLDDVHRLSVAQRDFLLDTLLARRSPTAVWIAERRAALTPDLLLSLGSRQDRDEIVLDIERFWRNGSRRGVFESQALKLADRRSRMAATATPSFVAMLERPDDQDYEEVLGKVEHRLLAATEGRREFSAWIDDRLDRQDNARERAITLRALEIRIRRELSRSQMSFDMFVRDEETLDQLDSKRAASNVREAAELFLCTEHGLPYYFGSERLAQLGSVNVDQFLRFAGDLFEELSGAVVLDRVPSLDPSRQEQLVQASVRAMWDRLDAGVPDGNAIRGLLDGIGEFAATRTYEPTAPYAPGVTGVGIVRSRAEELQAAIVERPDSWEAVIGRMLATLIAYNLITVRPSEAKGRRWAVYYLNRALCVRYRLPLGLGGWQPVSPDQLYEWSRGDRVRRSQGRLAA